MAGSYLRHGYRVYELYLYRYITSVAVETLIRRVRLDAGLTQAELAARLQTTQSAIARLERPGANPRMDTLIRLMQASGHRLEMSATQALPEVDETLIATQLRLSPAERVAQFEDAYAGAREVALAGARSRGELA